MKRVNLISKVIMTAIFFIHSCGKEVVNTEQKKDKVGGSYELGGPSFKDTINMKDANGHKQGLWIIYKTAVTSQTVYSKYLPDTVTHKKISYTAERVKSEEGIYKDNKKEGVWKNFYPNGKVKDSMVYNSGLIKP